jgi:hypothetical protein
MGIELVPYWNHFDREEVECRWQNPELERLVVAFLVAGCKRLGKDSSPKLADDIAALWNAKYPPRMFHVLIRSWELTYAKQGNQLNVQEVAREYTRGQCLCKLLVSYLARQTAEGKAFAHQIMLVAIQTSASARCFSLSPTEFVDHLFARARACRVTPEELRTQFDMLDS